MNHLVLTVIAQDQTGLVERIAKCIAEHQGNWLESRMARMAGQFAGILRVAVPVEHRPELVEALQGLERQGVRVLVADSGNEPSHSWKAIQLSLVGNDRPGIVRHKLQLHTIGIFNHLLLADSADFYFLQLIDNVLFLAN